MTDANKNNGSERTPVGMGEVMIHVDNLKKAFGDNVVLNGITQDIRKGEKVVIIGPSGSGKSTFLRCLHLLEVPTSGKIIFEGVDLTSKDADINTRRSSGQGGRLSREPVRRTETEDRDRARAGHESGYAPL